MAAVEANDQITMIERAAEAHYKASEFKQAGKSYKQALKLCDKTATTDAMQKVRLLLGLGDCYYASEQYSEAIAQFNQALSLDKNLGTAGSALVERCLDNLASASFHRKKFEEAASIYQQLVKYDEQFYGTDSIELLWALLDLAASYRKLGEPEKNEQLRPRILALLHTALSQQASGAENNGRAMPAGTEQKRPLPLMAWRTASAKPDAVILCIHGLGLHATSFQGFAERMLKHNIGVAALDVRGFGSWQVARGHEKIDFDLSLGDIEGLIKLLHIAVPGTPIFLLGESMGGAIVLRFASMHPELINGVISAVPADKRYKQKTDSLKVAVNFVKHKDKQMPVYDILEKAATRDSVSPEVFDDPLMRAELSPSELLKFQVFMVETTRMANKIENTPVLMLQGMKDKLIKPGATIDLYNNISSADRNLLLVGECQHLIFEEVVTPDSVFDSVLAWINDHIKKTAREQQTNQHSTNQQSTSGKSRSDQSTNGQTAN